MPQVFTRIQLNRHLRRQTKAEDIFAVVRHTRRVAMPPDRINLVHILYAPILKRLRRRFYPGFFTHLARGRLFERFTFFLTARHGLPVTGTIRAFDQQHLLRNGINHDQCGARNFVGLIVDRHDGQVRRRVLLTNQP